MVIEVIGKIRAYYSNQTYYLEMHMHKCMSDALNMLIDPWPFDSNRNILKI